MSHAHVVSVNLSANPGAVPEPHFYGSAGYSNGLIYLGEPSLTAPALILPRNASDAVAYLDGLIHAACNLRNEYVEWAKSHDVALAA